MSLHLDHYSSSFHMEVYTSPDLPDRRFASLTILNGRLWVTFRSCDETSIKDSSHLKYLCPIIHDKIACGQVGRRDTDTVRLHNCLLLEHQPILNYAAMTERNTLSFNTLFKQVTSPSRSESNPSHSLQGLIEVVDAFVNFVVTTNISFQAATSTSLKQFISHYTHLISGADISSLQQLFLPQNYRQLVQAIKCSSEKKTVCSFIQSSRTVCFINYGWWSYWPQIRISNSHFIS